MMKRYSFLLSFLVISSGLKAQVPACDTDAIKTALSSYTRFYVASNPCAMYFVNNSNKTWAASQADAAAVGGFLATMTNQTENDDVVTGLVAAGYPTNDNFWIGLNAQGASSDPNPANWGWNWVDGSAYGFQNWVGGAPDNASGFPGNVPEDAVQIRLSDGKWNTLMSQNAGLFPAPTGKGIIKINLCPVLTATPGAAVCSGAATTISVSTTLGSPSYTYSVFLPPSLVPVASGSTSSIAVSPPTVGNNSFLVLSQDRYGCPDTSFVNITGNNCTTPTTTCNLAAIRAAFAASGNYTELVVTGQDCSMYFIDNRSQDAAQAEADANTLGAHLVVLNDANENANVLASLTAGGYLANNARVWLGYKRVSTGSALFYTLDGSTGNFLPPTSAGGPTPGIYQNWDVGEPNNNDYQCSPVCGIGCNSYACTNGEQCVQMRFSGNWNDLPCDGTSKSVIEVNLCPQTTASRDTIVCTGGSIAIAVSTILGSNPITHTWSPGGLTGNTVNITPASPTTYTVTASDRYGCTGRDSVFVNINSNCNPPVGPVGCDILAIRNAFAASGARYTELPVSGQTCSMYFIDNNSIDAAQAETDANTLGAHLVVFNDLSENTDVVAALNAGGYLAGNAPVWIGVKRVSNGNSQFYTLDNSTGNFTPGPSTPTLYQNWGGGEPNNNRPGCCTTPILGNTCLTASDNYKCNNGEQCVQIYSSGQWNDLSCNRTSKSVIEVNLCPELRGSGDTTLCASLPITLTTSTILGSQPYTYDWTPGGQTTANITVTPPTGTTPYIATATDRYGCKGKDTITVSIVPIPTPVLVANPSVSSLCTGENITISNSTPGISPTATFNWNFAGATIVSGSGAGPYVLNWTTPGQKIITLDVNEGSCTAPQASINISVGNPPTVDAGRDTFICSGGSIQIGSPNIPGYTYTWSNTTELNNASIANPSFTYLNFGVNPTTFSLTVVASDNGCTASDQVNVTVNPPSPTTIVANNNNTFCAGTTVDLESTDTTLTGLVWSTGQTSTILSVTSTGNYNLTGTDASGCKYVSNSISTTQVPVPNAITVANGLNNESCTGYNDGAIILTSTTGTPPYQYIWNTTPPQAGNTITNLTPGTYYVTVLDNNNCTAQNSFTIQPAALFGVTIDSAKDVSCFGKNDGRFYATAYGGATPYRYLWSNGVASKNLFYATAGTYIITVTEQNGCKAMDTASIIEPPQIVITANYQPELEYFTETTIDVSVSPLSSYTYLWSPTNIVNCIDCEDVTTVGIRTTKYTVKAYDQNTGCFDSLNIIIKVDASKHIYIPNAFTPNEDSRNDKWQVFTKGIKYFKVDVFNRWGELVFSSVDLNEGWDGTYKDAPASPGIYPYQVNITYLDGEVIKSKGSINLIK